jgi:autotransporter adhesin
MPAAQVSSLQSSMARALAVSDAQFGALSGRVDTLFDLAAHDRKQNRQGIAATAALTSAPMPSEAGRTSYAANSAIYRGEVGFGASLAHRIDAGNPFALTAGVSHSGGKNTVARIGFAGEF